MTPGGATLVDWGLGSGIGCTTPLLLLGEEEVCFLRSLADKLDREVGYSRETPPRVQSVQHLVGEAVALFQGSVLPQLCGEAGEELRLHPSAHFGCSFNRTRDSGEGYADPWHLDAAAYTAIVQSYRRRARKPAANCACIAMSPRNYGSGWMRGAGPTRTMSTSTLSPGRRHRAVSGPPPGPRRACPARPTR